MKKAIVLFLSLFLILGAVGAADGKHKRGQKHLKLTAGLAAGKKCNKGKNPNCPPPPPPPAVQCADGVDNDGDGFVDFPADPGCTSATDTTESPNPPPPPPPGDLRPVDGGADFYGLFTNPLPATSDYFPIGVWGAYNFTAENVAKDKAAGLNLYVWNAGTEDWGQANIAAQGMHTFQEVGNNSNIGAHTRGWMLDDEADMQQGPGNNTTTCDGPHPQSGAESGYQRMRSKLALVPDGRITYANYGKGIAGPQWETDAQAACFVNAFQDVTSADMYWHTDPNESSAQSGNSWGYGQTVDRVRYLDGLDGVRKPIWNFIELVWPWSEPEGTNGLTRPTAAEIRGAVWHSIIAGARGIVYFQHSFAGSCTTHHAIRESGTACYGAMITGVTQLNQQVQALAPVLNAPFEDSFASVSSGVRLATKNLSGVRYVLAASNVNISGMRTFTVGAGSTATVLNEGRSIPISGGTFSDSFADGNAVHIYRIDG